MWFSAQKQKNAKEVMTGVNLAMWREEPMSVVLFDVLRSRQLLYWSPQDDTPWDMQGDSRFDPPLCEASMMIISAGTESRGIQCSGTPDGIERPVA